MTKEEFCAMNIRDVSQIPIQELIQMVGNQVEDYPHFSTNNKKLGSRIGQINMPTILSCADGVPCIKTCYANKGNQAAPNPRWCYFLNWLSYFKDKDRFFDKLSSYIKYEELNFMRYFSTGDLPDAEFFERAVRLAEETQTKYLMFTKKGYIVNNYLDNGGQIPDNLSVVLSNWHAWRQPNPHGLPTAWIKLRHEECEIPENAVECSGFCKECVYTENSCWDMKNGDAVFFNQH